MMTEATGTNGLDPIKTQGFVGEIEGLMADLRSEKGAYMNRCRGIRESISSVFDKAKDSGVDRKALKHEIKVRERDRKSDEEYEDLEADQRDQVELIRNALGNYADTPLGQAAMSRAQRDGQPRPRRRRRGETLDGAPAGV
jgi:uncharacterized protein (UPF0335 family)